VANAKMNMYAELWALYYFHNTMQMKNRSKQG
jgi:hypothetical protein